MPDLMRQGYEYWNRQFSERPAGLLEERLLDNLESQGMLSTYDGPSVETLAKAGAGVHSEVFTALVGNPPEKWDGLDTTEIAGWANVALTAIGFSETSNEGSPQWAASQLWEAWWQGALHEDAKVKWEDMQPEAKLAWEAVARHLAAMVMDGEENSAPPGPQGGWGNWAKKKMEPLHTTP